MARNEKDRYGRRQRRINRRGQFTRRTLLIGAGQLGLFGLLAARLHQIQIVEGGRFRSLADDNRVKRRFLLPVRGRILDRHRRPVAANNENLRVLIIPDLIRRDGARAQLAGDINAALDRLAEIISLPQVVRMRVVETAHRQGGQLPIVVVENLTWKQFARVNVSAPDIAGVLADIGWTRHYLFGADLAHVTGYVGAAGRIEIIGNPALRLPGAAVGKSGVEEGLNAHLSGRFGALTWEVNARGRANRKLHHRSPRAGRDLVLTIDVDTQRAAMARLAKFRAAAAVVLDARTGGIVACASTPSFDPNKITFGISKAAWAKLHDAPYAPLSNKAIRGQYPPASTFKMVTALAGLQAGLIDPDWHVVCSGGYNFKKQHYRCWKREGHGHVSLYKALKHSCDVYFYELARQVGISRLAEMARRLGLGQVYDIGLPAQKPGLIPDPDWKRAYFEKNWYTGETIIAGIGQGYVLATPLQLAVMTARIATGRIVEPRIALAAAKKTPGPARKLDINENHLDLVRRAMIAVVNETGGTAAGAGLNLPGRQMAGKTGTAQVQSNKGKSYRKLSSMDWSDRPHALFVGYAPATAPRYVVSIIVEHGGKGSRAAAPVARDIMRDLLERDAPGQPATCRGRDCATTAPRRIAKT